MSEAQAHPIRTPGRLPTRVLTEQALGRRIVAGDTRAFAELFRRHQQALYGYCVSVLGNQEDAADALQNTMTKALTALPGESRELKLKPWLFRVAHNECIDLVRARKQTENIAEHDPAAAAGVESTVVTRERLRQVLSDLGHLPQRQRSALVMRELNGFTFAEIAAALKTSPGAAKQVVYEARCALQVQAEGYSMECESVRESLSQKDGRVLGGRRIRAHLRSCQPCDDFKSGIEARRVEMRALIPPIPVAVALSILEMTGSSSGGGGLAGLLGLTGGKAALSGGAVKAVAVVAVTVGVGAGTVGIVEDTRQSSDPGSGRSEVTPGAAYSTVDPMSSAASAQSLPSGSERRLRERAGRGAIDHPADPSGERRQNPDEPGFGERDQAAPDLPGDPSAPGVPSPPWKSPGVPGPPGKSPGGSGGAKGNGAIPSHGGRPSQLPPAAAGGQAQAESNANPNSAVNRPVGTGKPTSPKSPPEPEAASPGRGNPKNP